MRQGLYVFVAASSFLLAAQAGAQTNPSPSNMKDAPSTAGAANKSLSDSADYSASMRRLLEAAQKLRDATHLLVEKKTDVPARNEAIRQANEALKETQLAMLALPVELRNSTSSTPEQDRAMEKLKQAAQKLREATQAMAGQPAGPRRSAAMGQTNEALLETQQAMVNLLALSEPASSSSAEKK